jgi:hypothetical protein
MSLMLLLLLLLLLLLQLQLLLQTSLCRNIGDNVAVHNII